MRHLLQINGLDGPLLNQFGCECNRCRAPERRANTSASLITLDDQGQTVHHLLFDAGLGVVDNLNNSPYLQGPAARLDGIALTHWHPDHVAELNRLCVSHYNNRKRRGWETERVPLYCRSGTAAHLARENGHVLQTYLKQYLPHECEPPGTILSPLPLNLAGVTVTPVSVSHYTADLAPDNSLETSYCCASFVIEVANSKAALLWDIDSENEWLVRPRTAAQEQAVALLSDADLLIVDTTFWRRPTRKKTHPSFENVMRYARTLQPRRTLLVHLSGHPDGPGNPGFGWTNAEWTQAASAAWLEAGLSGAVAAPSVGEIVEL